MIKDYFINKESLKTYEEDEDLLMELVVMANRSGNLDELEKGYIYELGKELTIERQFIDELF